MSNDLVCWNCGASIAALTLPLARLDICPSCEMELHACRMCRFFNTSVTDQCDETLAEPVMEKERANFCGYFMPSDKAFHKKDDEAERQAMQELHALFGLNAMESKQKSPSAHEELEALFGGAGKK